MTASSPGPSGQNIFSMFSGEGNAGRDKRETFLLSMLGQTVMLALIIYFTRTLVGGAPPIVAKFPPLDELLLVFSGHNGGGGGNFDPLPPSNGNIPKASLDPQLVPPTVMHPTSIPKLAAPETVVAAPDVKLLQGGQIGDPLSRFSGALSNGPGGPGGNGRGCCDGDGSFSGPSAGDGPPGIHPAGRDGVSYPEVIFNPEPSFSDEARKAKQQGIVLLQVVVGKDGHTYDIHVRQSLGMGLDEKAMEAVSRWRFRPATFHGQPVATQIAVQVDFRLY
jgi:protein TonB